MMLRIRKDKDGIYHLEERHWSWFGWCYVYGKVVGSGRYAEEVEITYRTKDAALSRFENRKEELLSKKDNETPVWFSRDNIIKKERI